MSKIIKLQEKKAKKEGEYTPNQLIEDVEKIKYKTQAIVAVQLLEDETILASWSNINNTEAIGLLEVAKDQILKDMKGL